MKSISAIILITLISGSDIFSQSSKTDSLLQVLKTAKQDTNKVKSLDALSWELQNKGEYEKAMQYANDALSLSEKISFKKGIADSYNSIGIIYTRQGNYRDALKNHFASLKIRAEVGYKKGIAASYNNIGIIYYKQGNYPDALKNHFASLKIREELGDKKVIAFSYNNIGNIYMGQGNYPDALKNYFASLKIMEELGDKKGIADSYNNIGIIYDYQGNYPYAQKNYFACLKIMEELGDKNVIAASYNNIGVSYDYQGNYPDAQKNYFASLKIREEIGDKDGIAASYINLGLIKLKMANITQSSPSTSSGQAFNKGELHIQAKKYLDDALFLSKEIGSKESIKESYSILSSLDSAQGKAAIDKQLWQLGAAYFGKSLEHYKMYIIYRDSIDNEETRKKTIQTTMTYDFDKKEAATKAAQDKKDAVATEEKRREKVIRYSVSGGLALTLVFAIFIFRGYKQKQKANIIITQQKEEVEMQKKVVVEKSAKLGEALKDIQDSIRYALRIQKAMFPHRRDIWAAFPESFILFKPKDVVSGDFYWFAEVEPLPTSPKGRGTNAQADADEIAGSSSSPEFIPTKEGGRLGGASLFYLAIADCTGHGVPGAFMSLLNISFLNEAVNEKGITQPNEVFNYVRKKLIEHISQEEGQDGMDAILLCFDYSHFEGGARRAGGVKLTYVAANNAPLIIRDGKIMKLEADKMPVGKSPKDNHSFTHHQVLLQKEDIIICFTDGYADQFGGPKGKKFRYKQLEELLVSIQHKPMAEQHDILNDTIVQWQGNLEQVDDICVIGVRL